MKYLIKQILLGMVKILSAGDERRYQNILQQKRRIVSVIRSHKYQKACRNSQIIICDIRELFLVNALRERYSRLDTVVRYMTVEKYLKGDENAFVLYKKMQKKRLGSLPEADKWCNRYKDLITSMIHNGYQSDSKLTINESLEIHDGSHRTALCLFNECKEVPCFLIHYEKKVQYGIRWFVNNGFLIEEILEIKKKYEELIERFNLPYCYYLKYRTENDIKTVNKIFTVLFGENSVSQIWRDLQRGTVFCHVYDRSPQYENINNRVCNLNMVKVERIIRNRNPEIEIYIAKNFSDNEELLKKCEKE